MDQSQLVRSLVVEATATRNGTRSVLYGHVTSLPGSSPTPSLVDLLPTSTLVSSEVYELPIKDRVQVQARDAATILGIELAQQDEDDSDRRPQRRHAPSQTRVRVVQEGNKLVLQRDAGSYDDGSDEVELERTAAGSTRAGEQSSIDSRRDAVEFIVVLEIETSFGGFENPKFANMVTIPVPECSQSTLRFAFAPPPPSAPEPVWDLKISPTPSHVESFTSPARTSSSSTRCSSPTGTAAAVVTCSLPQTSTVSLRWVSRLAVGVPVPELSIARSEVDVDWTINELGWGRATVQVAAEWEYLGLGDKHWVRLEVGSGKGRGARGFASANDVCEVVGVEGTGVVGWEIDRAGSREGSGPRLDDDRPACTRAVDGAHEKQGTVSIESRTPTPRRRYSSVSAKTNTKSSDGARSPIWTSLFDTAPPVVALPDLDASLIVRERGGKTSPSLLRQAAPFDPETSGMDMCFEDSSAGGTEEEQTIDPGDLLVDQQLEEATIEDDSTTILIQLSLSELVFPTPSSDPSRPPRLSFCVHLDFPAITLRALTVPTHSSLRLAIPSFSLPDARQENTLVSVSARSVDKATSSQVDLVAPPPSPPSSPLPAIDGTARWSSVRSHARNPSPRDDAATTVEVDIALPFSVEGNYRAQPAIAPAALNGPVDGVKKVRPKQDVEDRLKTRKTRARTSTSDRGEDGGHAANRQTLPLVRVEITPISPTLSLASPSPSDWRIFYRFDVQGGATVDELTIPLPPMANSKVKVHDVWGPDGRSLEFSSDRVGRRNTSRRVGQEGRRDMDEAVEEEKGLRIVSAARDGCRGIAAVLYEEKKSGEDIEGAALLPFLEQRVGKCEVRVLEAQGYDLHVVVHDFDLSDRSISGSTLFTKFLMRPDTRPFLPLRFKPSPSSSSVSTSSTSVPGKQLKKGKKEFNAPREWLDFAYTVPMYLVAIAMILAAAIKGGNKESAPHSAPVVTPALASTSPLYPIISYSTLTKTSLAVSTTTVTRTVSSQQRPVTMTISVTPSTITHTKYLAGSAEPTPTPRAPRPAIPTIADFSISADVGNSVLIWLERLRISVREYWEELMRTIRLVR